MRLTRIQQLQHECSSLKDRIAAAKKRHESSAYLEGRLIQVVAKLIRAELRDERKQRNAA